MVLDKKSKSEIIKKIVESVSQNPKSMYGLSKELNSNWDTIKGNVELLRELGILDVSEQKVFLKRDCSISMEDAVAGLPLSDQIRKRIYALAKIVRDKWVESTGKEPNNTQLQKAMVEVIEKFPSLDIPRGWYFYGKIVLVKIDKEKLTKDLDKFSFKEFSINIKELENEVKSVIKKISKFSNSELLDYQYKKYNKKDYMIKREIDVLFLSKKFDKQKFSNLLYQLIFNFKTIKDDELNHKVLSITKEAISIMISRAFSRDADEDREFRIQLMEAFSTFWKLYTTYGLLESLEGKVGYDIRIVRSIFDDRINFYTKDLADSFVNCAAD